jgi:gliding motility-associated-like protein
VNKCISIFAFKLKTLIFSMLKNKLHKVFKFNILTYILNAFLILCLINIDNVKSQSKESNWWYFGNYAGINFTSGVPVAVTDNAMFANQGCASISDANGNLLFYTNGVNVWNRNHTVMPNGSGLLGNASATQSAIIVQKPGSTSIYYIFTVPASGGGNLTYSEVNMNLQGGLGDITGTKNIPLSGPVTERVTAVKHCNNVDVWVITHLWNSSSFHAFLLTAAGINSLPVISNVGSLHTGSSNFMGYLKASSNGSKLACAIRYMNIFEIFDFNNNTGVVSNALTSPATFNFPYGVEFSPDATKLYVSCGVGGTNQIWQFDLLGGTSTAIFGSATLIGTPVGPSMGALQLGPNGKIYAAKYYQNYLGVINNPNALGTASNYVDNGLFLGGKQSQLGLPTFVQSLFQPSLSIQTLGSLNNYSDTCFGDQTSFQLSPSYGVLSIVWDFGDPASGAANTSTQLNPVHVFTVPGTYNVTAIAQFLCNTDTIQRTVQILPTPYVVLNDTNICTGTSIILDAGNPGANYVWNTGATTKTITVYNSGTYSVTVSNSSCSYSDTCTINVGPYLPVNVSDDIICQGGSTVLDAGYANSTYLWSTGETTQNITVNSPGIYMLTVTDPTGCSGFDDVEITAIPSPVINLPVTGICPGDSVLINAGNPGSTYVWNTGETTQSIYVNSAISFSVTVTNSQGCQSSSTGSLSWYPTPTISLDDTIFICEGSNAVLDAGNPGAKYLWSNGSTNKILNTSAPGLYTVSITSQDGCTAVASCDLIVNPLPYIDIYDTIMCPGDIILFDAGNAGSSYQWSTGTTNQTLLVAGQGDYSVTVTDNNNCSNTLDFKVTLIPLPEINMGPDRYLCEMEPFTLDAGNKHSITNYLWSTGDTTQTITVLSPGLYSVTITNVCGVADTNILIAIDDTCSWFMFIPNAFTPNGDGDNDMFKVITSDNVKNFEMRIYNRWGALLFTTNDSRNGWNGRYEGDLQINDVYTYIITFNVSNENNLRQRKGIVTLLR